MASSPAPNAGDEPSWPCDAYGPEGLDVGALCFRAEQGARVCRDLAECQGFMAGERQRAFRTMNELAAAGDGTWAYVSDHISSPDELLGGDSPKSSGPSAG